MNLNFFKFLQSISKKLASFVDEFLCKHTRLQNFVFILADKLIHIIQFTVCNKKFYITFNICSFVYGGFLLHNLRSFYGFLDIYGYTWPNLVIAYHQFIPIHLVIFLLFIQFLIEIYIFCLILKSIPCVNSYLVKHYGPVWLKKVGLDPFWLPYKRFNMVALYFFLGYTLYGLIYVYIEHIQLSS